MNNYPKQRIVIAEDNVFQRGILRNQLANLGYMDVLDAASGIEALTLCHQNKIDLLICDLRMPGMDGMALLRHLSTMPFRGSVIICSALEQPVIDSVLLMGQAFGLQILGSIRKPVSATRIQALLTKQHYYSIQVKNCNNSIVTLDDLCQALDKGTIKPWYQPKVSFKNGEFLGTEALARWFHPEKGFVPPSEFISLAEQNGLIDKLTDSIFSQSIQKAHLWAKSGLSINLSINLSAQSLPNTHLFDSLLEYCRQWGVNPKMVTIEITEGTFIGDIGRALESATRMRMNGFGLSIDDFGTGFASIQQLTTLPFTELKLDRSFISRCYEDKSSMAIVQYSLNLAKQLGLKSVAEGVEDEKTWQILATLGCDICQGFFSARPMPENELSNWYRKWRHQVYDMKLFEHL